MTTTGRPMFVVGIASLLLALPGCAAAPTRVGGAPPPRTLSAATYFNPGYPAGDQLQHLIQAVGVGAPGELGLEGRPTMEDPSGAGNPGLVALDAVRRGDVDVAIVPARVFDLVGVTSLQALQAPFHFTSTEQADAFLDDPVAAEMLEPLSVIGVTGLALTFDGLRNVIGYQHPMTAPNDFAGATIAALPSRATDSVLTALGASVSRENGQAFARSVEAGRMTGLEDSINQPNGQVAGWTVGNAFLSFKADVIVVNTKVWDGLTTAQRAALRGAAENTRNWSRTTMPQHVDLATAASRFCASGAGDAVVASSADLRALRSATEPVVEAMTRDPLTAKALAVIDALAGELPGAAHAAPCTRAESTPEPPPPVEPVGDQSVLNGTWRMVVEAEPLLASGATPQDASGNTGVWTFTYRDGNGSYAQNGIPGCAFTYQVAGDQVSTQEEQAGGCGGAGTLTYRRAGDRLYFSVSGDDPNKAFLNAFFAGGLRLVTADASP